MFKKIIIGLIILVVIAVAAVYFFVDPIVEKQARKIIKENVPIKIEFSSVHIGFLPPSVKVNDIKVYNKDKAEINIDQVKVVPEIMPLLSKKIVVSSIKVNEPVITAYQTKTGTNIQDIISKLTKEDKTKTKKKEESEINLEVGNIYVRKAKLLFYQNIKDSKALIDISPVNIDIGKIKLGDKTLETSFKIAAGLFGNSPNVSLKGYIKPFADKISGKGDISIDKFNLSDVKKLVKDSMNIKSGVINVKAPFTLEKDKVYIGDVKIDIKDIKLALVKSEESVKTPVSSQSSKGPEIPEAVNINSINCQLSNIEIVPDNKKPNVSALLKEGDLSIGKIAYNVSNSDIKSKFVLSRPEVIRDLTGKLNITKGIPSADVKVSLNNLNMVTLNPFVEDISPAEIESGVMNFSADGLVSWQKLDLKCKSVSENLKLKGKKGTTSKVVFGVPVPLLIKYLSETDGKLVLDFSIYGSVMEPKADISKVLGKILGRVITDMAITNTIGLPAVIGDKILEKTTGKSVIKSTKDKIKGFFKK